jgi:hypothetical protein
LKLAAHRDQAFLRRLELERFEHRLTSKLKRTKKNRKRSGGSATATAFSASDKKRTYKRTESWIDVPVPNAIDLHSNREATCDFIQQVREEVRSGKRLRLVFDSCETIRLSALVLLLAQIHKLRMQYGSTHLTGTYPKSSRLERLLSESGFYGLLGVKSRSNRPSKSKLTRYVKFKSEQKPNSQEIPNLRNELLGNDLKMPKPIASRVFRGVSEAMTNVNHHAYNTKHIEFHEQKGRWWLVASLSARTKLFTLAFYDAGVGISKTLPRKYPIELIRGVLSLLPGVQPDDGQMIRAAMELGRSRTDQSNRGKGLLDLTKLIDIVGQGEMRIYSRNGAYSYAPSGEREQNANGFVEGTLIEWQLPIDKALEVLPQELIYDEDSEN